MTTANDNIKKDELVKKLKDPGNLLIEGENLSHLNLGNMDLSGKTFKQCDISDTNFGNCVGLPTIEECSSHKEKATDVTVVKSKNGALTIFSMIRGSKPFYMINGKEYPALSAESAMVSQVRRLASVIK